MSPARVSYTVSVVRCVGVVRSRRDGGELHTSISVCIMWVATLNSNDTRVVYSGCSEPHLHLRPSQPCTLVRPRTLLPPGPDYLPECTYASAAPPTQPFGGKRLVEKRGLMFVKPRPFSPFKTLVMFLGTLFTPSVFIEW